MNYKSAVVCFFILASVVCKAQQYKFIYYLDADLSTVAKKKATLIGKGLYEDKLFRLDCYAAAGNALLLTLHFTDSALTHLQGPYKSYHLNDKTEKEGNFVNDLEEGAWFKYDTLGMKTDSISAHVGVT